MLKSRGLKWNEYPHREKWLIANLKVEPGKRPLGSSTARKPTKDQHPNQILPPTYTWQRNPAQPAPCLGEEADQAGGDLTPWAWQMQALVATRPAQASGRPRPVPCSSHRRGISIQGIQESRLQKHKQPWLLCLLQGPRQLQHEEQQRKGDIYTGSFPGFKHFPTMSSSSFLNTLQICSPQALNWSRLLSLPAGDAPGSILLKKDTLLQEFTL